MITLAECIKFVDDFNTRIEIETLDDDSNADKMFADLKKFQDDFDEAVEMYEDVFQEDGSRPTHQSVVAIRDFLIAMHGELRADIILAYAIFMFDAKDRLKASEGFRYWVYSNKCPERHPEAFTMLTLKNALIWICQGNPNYLPS